MTVSNKIKAAAAIKGISLAALAGKIGSSPQSVSNKIGRDSFTASDIVKIAAALDLRLALVDHAGKIVIDFTQDQDQQ